MELELEPLRLPSDNERPFVIAGPCSAESEEQVMTTAKQLAMYGCHNFRAGVWKPRTKPGGFEGHGEPALVWLQQVKKETKMLVATEVATPEHVELCLKYGIDILWIGARTTANPFAMQALADSLKGADVPVFVKNPVNPDLELWIGALERLNQAGVKRMAAIHRGFSSYDKKIYRNMPMWQIPIELHRRIPELPIINDPSHIGGRRELIAPLCQQAMDLGFDGLIVESHCDHILKEILITYAFLRNNYEIDIYEIQDNIAFPLFDLSNLETVLMKYNAESWTYQNRFDSKKVIVKKEIVNKINLK